MTKLLHSVYAFPWNSSVRPSFSWSPLEKYFCTPTMDCQLNIFKQMLLRQWSIFSYLRRRGSVMACRNNELWFWFANAVLPNSISSIALDFWKHLNCVSYDENSVQNHIILSKYIIMNPQMLLFLFAEIWNAFQIGSFTYSVWNRQYFLASGQCDCGLGIVYALKIKKHDKQVRRHNRYTASGDN